MISVSTIFQHFYHYYSFYLLTNILQSMVYLIETRRKANAN